MANSIKPYVLRELPFPVPKPRLTHDPAAQQAEPQPEPVKKRPDPIVRKSMPAYFRLVAVKA